MNKTEVAFHQLKRSFLLFAREKDYLSALTLAGAADEILGKLVAKSDQSDTTALEDDVDLIRAIMLKLGDSVTENEIRDYLLYPRNAAKHLLVGTRSDFTFDIREEAESFIERAVNNYYTVTGWWPDDPSYDEFLKAQETLNEEMA